MLIHSETDNSRLDGHWWIKDDSDDGDGGVCPISKTERFASVQ